MKIVICTGGFDPIHKGHIEYFKAAKKLGDKLIIGLNSDDWLIRKKIEANCIALKNTQSKCL